MTKTNAKVPGSDSPFLEQLIADDNERAGVMCQAEEILDLLAREDKAYTLAQAIYWIARMNIRPVTKFYLIYLLSRNAGIQHQYDALKPVFDEHALDIPQIPLDQRDVNPIVHAGSDSERERLLF